MNENFKVRLQIELIELTDKLSKLDDFISNNPIFDNIDPDQRDLLKLQSNAMVVYRSILEMRIKLTEES